VIAPCFPGTSGKPLDHHNWRARTWAPLLAKTGPDDENPQRVAIEGIFHMLRHFYVTALISSGVNAKVAQTLAGHHSAAFTLDQYADAVPHQLEEAGEKVASVLLSGSILVAAPKTPAQSRGQVIELNGAPGEIRTPDLLVRSQALYPTELRAHLSKIIGGGERGIARRYAPRPFASRRDRRPLRCRRLPPWSPCPFAATRASSCPAILLNRVAEREGFEPSMGF
jgi:hypothetical protein